MAYEPLEVGTKVRIIANESGHCFEIGEIVTVTERKKTYYDDNGYYDYRGNNECSGWFGFGEYELAITKLGNIYTNEL